MQMGGGPIDSQMLMRRLAFIKHLYGTAVRQSEQPEPLRAASILTFHDSVELFLHLVCERKNVKCDEARFMEYWTLLKPAFPPDGLTQIESMRRLNDCRKNLKHHGQLPSKLDIEGHRAVATSFFEENTPTVFGVEFSEVSMIDLVESKTARDHLKEAQKLTSEEKIDESFSELALAFNYVLDEYENSERDRYGISPYSFGGSMRTPRGFEEVIGYDLAQVVDAVRELQEALRIVGMGLDFRRHAKFSRLTPHVTRIPGGKPILQERQREKPRSIEDYHFCMDFVIDSAIVLSE